MSHVDLALLNLIEGLCRRFQTWTGRTNVWLAFQLTNLSIALYFIWVIGLYWLSGSLGLRLFIAFFCGGVFVMLTRTIFRTSVDFAEAEAYRRVSKGFMNPRRMRDAQLRIAFLTCSIFIPFLILSILRLHPQGAAYVASQRQVVILTTALSVLTTIVLYLLACDPLPPCPGKVREWIGALGPARAAKDADPAPG